MSIIFIYVIYRRVIEDWKIASTQRQALTHHLPGGYKKSAT